MAENKKDYAGLPQDGRRTEYIGAKVTAEQKRYIRQLAGKCGMTVSDYLLVRAFGYKPKERLTERQTAIIETLVGCRSDLVSYTSAFCGMNLKKRGQMFGSYPFMLGWLKELGKLADRITDDWTWCRWITACPKEQGTMTTKRKNHDSKGKVDKPRRQRHPLHHGRDGEQNTPSASSMSRTTSCSPGLMQRGYGNS